jgi:hypothetical protein
MGKGTLEKFGLRAIADALDGSDVVTARRSLSAVVGAVVEVSGTVQKRVKRDGQCKLVIEPGASVPGFVVFADCPGEVENLTKLNIRKGSLVRVKGKFQTFGAAAVCLSECKLEQVGTLKKRNKRNNSTRTELNNVDLSDNKLSDSSTRTECSENLKKPEIDG